MNKDMKKQETKWYVIQVFNAPRNEKVMLDAGPFAAFEDAMKRRDELRVLKNRKQSICLEAGGYLGKEAGVWDTCSLKIHSYIHGIGKKGKKVIQMFNTKQNNMNNVQFKPEGQLKEMGVTYNVKAQLGRPVNPNSKRQQRLATAPGKKTGRPINPTSARQQRLAELDAKRANGTLKRGRPVNPNSARQIALQEAIAKAIANQG